MIQRFTISHIDRLLKDGKIRGYTLTKPAKKKETPATPKPSKEKTWIAWNLKIWCEERGLELKTEHRFHPDRKWRFDWAIPSMKIAIEYNGIFSEKSRHLTAKGHTGDVEKLNAAQMAGWVILQLTPLDYRNLITHLNFIWTCRGK